jgi:hypothetical protein
VNLCGPITGQKAHFNNASATDLAQGTDVVIYSGLTHFDASISRVFQSFPLTWPENGDKVALFPIQIGREREGKH